MGIQSTGIFAENLGCHVKLKLDNLGDLSAGLFARQNCVNLKEISLRTTFDMSLVDA